MVADFRRLFRDDHSCGTLLAESNQPIAVSSPSSPSTTTTTTTTTATTATTT